MKLRHVVAASAAIALTATACGSSTGGGDLAAPDADTEGTLKVWLMEGSQPDTVVEAVNAQFNEAYPNVDVQVELQQWGGIQDKLTTSLNTDATPCVAEIGNSLTAKFADAGLLADLTDVAGDLGEENWLPGLAPSGELDGERYGIPYYGGVRIVMYNKEHFAEAGVEIPTTLDELESVAAALSETKGTVEDGYSAFYFPGKYWYGALPFVWTTGGDIAGQDGDEWVGEIDSAESQEGLGILKNLVDSYSTAPKDGDETKNWEVFMEGNTGMVIDSWWAPGAVVATDPDFTDKTGVFPLPGVTADETAPVFFGGSDLGVSQNCAEQGLAVEWVKIITGEEIQTQLAAEGGVIPNNEAAFVGHEGNDFLLAADEAAKVSRFTPVSPNWGNVEAEAVLPDMLVKIFTEQATIEEATAEASASIADLLNG
ncbi:MAG: extracellular solute-binding protein [Jiangellales bacterium]